MPSRRGLALLVVVGTLGVLAVLGTAFASMAQLERKASLQRAYGAKALLLARSGVEDALARLALGQDPAYGGEDYDGDRSLDAGAETTEQVYRPGLLDTDDCPPGQALRPSFFVNDRTGTGAPPALERLEGRLRGCSGRLSGDLRPLGNQYALRVTHDDGILVNGGDPAADPTQGYNAVLRRILGALCKAMDWQGGGGFNGVPVGQADGFNLVDLRPRTSRGWESFAQIRDRALGGSQAKLDALRPYLVLEAWVDTRVIRPNVDPAAPAGPYDSWTSSKLLRLQTGPDSRAPALEPRAPVSLDWARRRRPVLIALLSGLLQDNGVPWNPPPGIPIPELQIVANAILTSTSELRTWQQWNAFCDALPVLTSDLYSGEPLDPRAIQRQRDVLKANFNPNSDLNKFNPNRSTVKRVDKSDLAAYSTEFSLRSMNGHVLACEGRVLSPDGRIQARRTVTVLLAPPKAVRITTQREFAASSLGSLEFPGDEGAARIPGATAAPYISRSQTAERTWGHSTGGSLMYLANLGASLQTYPEPQAGAAFGLNPAQYDGNLQLATVETLPDAAMTALARFDLQFDLDQGGGTLAVQPDAQLVGASELGNSLLHAVKYNTLYPDGAYSERDRAPVYLDRGNSSPFRGVLSFWVKPNHDGAPIPWAPATRSFYGYVERSRFEAPYDPNAPLGSYDKTSQTFLVGNGVDYAGEGMNPPPYQGPDRFIAFHETTSAWTGPIEYSNTERLESTPPREVLGHRWHLVTFYWNFDQPASLGSRLVVNGGTGAADIGAEHYSPPSSIPEPTEDITLDDVYGPHTLSLGGRRLGSPACATIDEFAVYDFGTDPAAANTLASTRYKEGRYYRGSAYYPPGSMLSGGADAAASYYTAPIALPAGSTVCRMDWTWQRPQELPTDYAELELVTQGVNPAYLWSPATSRSTQSPGWARDRQAWDIGRTVSAPFRLRVVFRREIPVDLNTPILDSPVLDDLTLFYDPPGGPRLRAWRVD